MSKTIGKLMTAIKNRTFYYSIPIKAPLTTGEAVRANAFISGQNGFNEEFFGDKFFIAVAPESARLLLDMQQFVDAKELEETRLIVTPAVVVPVAPVPKKPSAKEQHAKMREMYKEFLRNGEQAPTS